MRSKMRRCASRKKSPRVDQLGGVVERVVVDQDRAEHGFLRVEVVRKRAFGCGEVGHQGLSGKEERRRADQRAQSVTENRLPP